MTASPRPPLTPEERELAQKLARIDASAPQVPSPALDAGILASARAALEPPASIAPAFAGPGRPHAHAARRPRASRRWPAGVGVAATLALAVGIAWQLRPMPEAPQAYSEAPPAAREQRVSGPSADDAAILPTPQESREEAQAVAASELAAAVPADAMRASKATSAPAQDADGDDVVAFPAESSAGAANAVASPEPAIVFDQAPVPPAPPPPPAPAGSAAPRAAAADAAAEAEAAPAPMRREAAEAKRRQAGELDRIEVTGARIQRDDAGFADQAIDDEPPATADSPAVQQAWLQRIRELISHGQTTGAKASLQEFKRRYPQYPLPPDLRAFDQ